MRRERVGLPRPRRRVRWGRLGGLLFLGYVFVLLAMQQWESWQLEAEQDRYLEEMRQVAEENARLEREIRYLQSDAYLERVAREELGLTRPGEVQYRTQRKADGESSPLRSEIGRSDPIDR